MGYSVALWRVTLTANGRAAPGFEPASNVVPLHSLLGSGSRAGIAHQGYYLIGNLLLLSPIPALWFLLTGRTMRILPAALLAAGVSAAIELVQWQLLPGRAGDIDDVILNTAGACVLAYVMRRFIHRRSGVRV